MHIYKSSQTIEIPTNVNLTELLHSSAKPLPTSHEIASDSLENRTVTLGQLRNRAGRLANGLKQRFKPSDQSRWAVILPNGLAYLESVHAILWLDGVFCPINYQLTAPEIAHAITVSKPENVIVWEPLVPKLLKSFETLLGDQPGLPLPKIVTALGTTGDYPSLYDSCMAAEELKIPHHADTRMRLASIHLSSGTTGKSKGVGLTHYNFVANVYQCFRHDPEHWSQANRSVPVTPMAHIANTTVPLFLSPWTGVNNLILHSFELKSYCEAVQKHKATHLQLMPQTVSALLSGHLRSYDLSSVKYLVGTGGVKKETGDKITGLGEWRFVNLYGMTEASPYVAWSRLSDEPPPGTIGFLLPNVEARLCGHDEKDVPEGQEGELWVRGPNVTNGYVENPEANASAFKDGNWYNTGDVCTFSPEGWLSLVGRTKELFKSSGFQVSPQELEAYLVAHPDIQEVCVGPTYNSAKSTEVATAYVVLKSDIVQESVKVKSLKSIQDFLDGKVSGYKKLRGGVWEVTGLQRNATGKVLRHLAAAQKTGLSSLGGLPRSRL